MIDDLSLTITLKIIGCGESMGYLILNAEAGHLLAGKVCPVVRDNGVGGSDMTRDVFPKNFDNLLSSDFEEWHCVHPFGGGYQQEPQLRLYLGEWTNYI